LGRLFGIVANFTDPDGYFVGGGVVDARPEFRDWYVERVRRYTDLRPEQQAAAIFALVPDLDMAGARGSALAAAAVWGTHLA
jgi:glucokinase